MQQITSLKNRVLGKLFKDKFKQKNTRFRIPNEDQSSTEFTNNIEKILLDPKTRIYIDTSFLMWLTKIGPISRNEFITWLTETFPNRICIPIWSAHEYLRHHIDKTILEELTVSANEMKSLAAKSYKLLRPYLDSSPNDKSANVESQQVLARRALNDLEDLSNLVKNLKKNYTKNADEVIKFINDHVPKSANIFSMVEGIQPIGNGRFDNRIPPGFQDRKKKNIVIEENSSEGETIIGGTNKFGDLIFWKEVLKESLTFKAKNAVIITNDQKNDWQMGGRDQPNEPDLRRLRDDWKPLPLAHPMLSFEGGVSANLDNVILLDSVYLGLYLNRHNLSQTEAFVDVALVPRNPTKTNTNNPAPVTTSENLNETQQSSKQTPTSIPQTQSNEIYRFQENFQVRNVFIALKSAWNKSAIKVVGDSPVADFLNEIPLAFAERRSVADLFIAERINGFNIDMLVSLGRNIHDDSFTNILGNPEALTDILNIMDTLPPITASSIYLGFLGSMYFDCETSSPRLPPASPVAEQIFDFQSKSYAVDAIRVIQEKFKKIDLQPLYTPDSTGNKIEIKLDHVPEFGGDFVLGSIIINGIEVFSEAQNSPDLNLSNLLQETEKRTAEQIIRVACSIYCIPFKQVYFEGNYETVYVIQAHSGFRMPKLIFKENEEAQS